MREIKLFILVVFLASLVMSASVQAQTSTPSPQPKVDDDIIKVESRLIVVPVSVTDSNGQPVLAR